MSRSRGVDDPAGDPGAGGNPHDEQFGRYVRRPQQTQHAAGRRPVGRKTLENPRRGDYSGVAARGPRGTGRKTPENPGRKDVATSSEAGRITPENHEPLDWTRPFVALLGSEKCAGQVYRQYVARIAHLDDHVRQHNVQMLVHVCQIHSVGNYQRRCAECRICACRDCRTSTVERAAWDVRSLDARVAYGSFTCTVPLSTKHAMCGFCGRSDNFICVGDGRSACGSCYLLASVDSELSVVPHQGSCVHLVSQNDYAAGHTDETYDDMPQLEASGDHEESKDLGWDLETASGPSAPPLLDSPVPVDLDNRFGILIDLDELPLIDLLDVEPDELTKPRGLYCRRMDNLEYRNPFLEPSHSQPRLTFISRAQWNDRESGTGYFSSCLSWLFEESEVRRPPVMPSKARACDCYYCAHIRESSTISSRVLMDARKSLRNTRQSHFEWLAQVDDLKIARWNAGLVFTPIPMPVSYYFRRAWYGDPTRRKVVIGGAGLASMFEDAQPTRKIGPWTSTVAPVRNPGLQADLYRRALFMTREMAHRKAVSAEYARALPDIEDYRPSPDPEDDPADDGDEDGKKSRPSEKLVGDVSKALARDNNVVEATMTVLPWNRHVTDPLYRPYVSDEQMPEHTYAAVLTRTVGMPIDQTSLKAVANYARNFIKSNYSWLTEPQVLRVMTIVQYKWQAQVSPIDNTVHHFAKKYTAKQVENISRLRTGAVLRSRFFGLWKSYEQVIPKTT